MTGRLATASLLALLLAACSHQPRQDAPGQPAGGVAPATGDVIGTPGVPEPPSARGNPPFYEVFGRRYHTMASADGYRERGVASWYGTKFHGQSTSSGEPYDMYAMTAAHPSLPLPTWVEVRHLDNGRRIVVRVNDRGPFVGNRIIDLSYAAARELGMVEDGTARVEVRALRGPDDISEDAILTASVQPREVIRTPDADGPPQADAPPRTPRQAQTDVRAMTPVATAPAGQSPSSDGGNAAARLFVQLGAFAQRDNAEGLTRRLQAGGLDGAFVQPGDGIYRVRIGPLESADAYDELLAQLARIDSFDPRLVTE